jgi:hypothetical protein
VAGDKEMLTELRSARAQWIRFDDGRDTELRLDIPPVMSDDHRAALSRLMIAEDRWRDR